MKIIGTKKELDWMESELPKLDECFLNAECVMVNLPHSVRVALTDNEKKEICKKCIEKNVVFEIEERTKNEKQIYSGQSTM